MPNVRVQSMIKIRLLGLCQCFNFRKHVLLRPNTNLRNTELEEADVTCLNAVIVTLLTLAQWSHFLLQMFISTEQRKKVLFCYTVSGSYTRWFKYDRDKL